MPAPTFTPRIAVAERAAENAAVPTAAATKIAIRNLNFYYGKTQALHNVSLEIPERIVMAFIGPSGCGKSTLLRTLNRMNDVIPSTRVEGEVLMDGRDIYEAGTDVVELRRKVGMVFQKSNPFPKSIFDNVAYGLRINRMVASREELRGRVEASLKSAALWEEVRDRLEAHGSSKTLRRVLFVDRLRGNRQNHDLTRTGQRGVEPDGGSNSDKDQHNEKRDVFQEPPHLPAGTTSRRDCGSPPGAR